MVGCAREMWSRRPMAEAVVARWRSKQLGARPLDPRCGEKESQYGPHTTEDIPPALAESAEVC